MGETGRRRGMGNRDWDAVCEEKNKKYFIKIKERKEGRKKEETERSSNQEERHIRQELNGKLSEETDKKHCHLHHK